MHRAHRRAHASLLLAALLVGCGGTTATPIAPARTLFAPDDLAFTIPREVGDRRLEVEILSDDQIRDLFDSGHYDPYRPVLVRHGKDPSAMSVVLGRWHDDTESIFITALRVSGIDATELVDPYWEIGDLFATPPPYELVVIGGKQMRHYTYKLTNSEFDDYVYTVGEVEYRLDAPPGLVESVVGELP